MEQAASDMVNFAQNVVFPWDPQAGSVASKTVSLVPDIDVYI
jgi:hypothetical protein